MKHFIFPNLHIRLRLYIVSFACYLSMVMSGVALTWPSPLTHWYSTSESEVPMTEHEVSWMVSIAAIGAGIASVPSGILADIFGRRIILLGTGVTSVLGWSLIMATRSKWALYVAQVLGGAVIGGAPCVAPIYIAEISPPKVRGAIVGQLNTMFFVGQLLVYAFGPLLTYSRYILFCASMPMLFIATFFFAPESPYYLINKGRDDEARHNMQKLRGKGSLPELELARQELAEKSEVTKLSMWQSLKAESHMKNIISLQVLSGVSQFNGLATLSVYAVEFLGGQWVAVAMGAIFVGASFFAAFLADPFGRRPLLISSLIGAAVSNALVATYFFVKEARQESYSILLYIGLFGFCFITSVGINPFVMTLPSELFPTHLRAFANGLTQLTTSFFCFLCLKIFVNINDLWGIGANFLLYTVVSLIGAGTAILLPETAMTTLSAT